MQNADNIRANDGLNSFAQMSLQEAGRPAPGSSERAGYPAIYGDTYGMAYAPQSSAPSAPPMTLPPPGYNSALQRGATFNAAHAEIAAQAVDPKGLLSDLKLRDLEIVMVNGPSLQGMSARKVPLSETFEKVVHCLSRIGLKFDDDGIELNSVGPEAPLKVSLQTQGYSPQVASQVHELVHAQRVVDEDKSLPDRLTTLLDSFFTYLDTCDRKDHKPKRRVISIITAAEPATEAAYKELAKIISQAVKKDLLKERSHLAKKVPNLLHFNFIQVGQDPKTTKYLDKLNSERPLAQYVSAKQISPRGDLMAQVEHAMLCAIDEKADKASEKGFFARLKA